MTLVDTNVLLDVVSADARWRDWSMEQLERRGALGPLVINDVIYAEMSVQFGTAAELAEALREIEVRLERVPLNALFLAGKAFRRYRQAGGVRTGVLPDFFVGAHAQVLDYAVLTRDDRRYRTCFPDVQLITPDQSP